MPSLISRDIRDYVVTITPALPGAVPIIIDGGQDEKFSITSESPYYETSVDQAGNVYRDYNADRRHTLTLNLMSTNPVNELLSALIVADTPIPLPVTDTFRVDIINRSTQKPMVLADKCFVMQDPDMTEGTTVGERNWEIMLPFPKIFHAGINPDV